MHIHVLSMYRQVLIWENAQSGIEHDLITTTSMYVPCTLQGLRPPCPFEQGTQLCLHSPVHLQLGRGKSGVGIASQPCAGADGWR
jgi:hypothetical protein